jgi:diguanylate cyclase (GGDEF)-like protein
VEDVTEQVAALDAVYRLAHHDTLTGLPNRVMLQDRLGQALISARRHRQSVAVMMLDLDHFKNVNDALGHAIGDGLLQEVAARLGGRLRASDTLARVGGDEFVLIQPDLIDRSDTGIVAQKLIDAFTEPFVVKNNRLDIGASIGVTVFPDDATDPDLLLRNADMALYRAKRNGRGQYRCYSPDMDAELKATRSLEAGLRQALECGTLELFYQPLFTLEDGRIQGVEALIRWAHPDGGYVSPASFIPVAETSGVIVPLGEWILHQACRQARAWMEAGWHLRVAVNLSAVQLRQPDFPILVKRVLDDSGLAACALELEITETVFLDPSKMAIAKALHEVAGIGVHLAIDDFGTGYSSLGYLKHFPFDRIKIDRSFVRDIGAEADADAIVKAIIALGRSLGKSITAEGVETELQLAFLRRNTCDEVQGYLLARPRSVSEIEQTLRHQLAIHHGVGASTVASYQRSKKSAPKMSRGRTR